MGGGKGEGELEKEKYYLLFIFIIIEVCFSLLVPQPQVFHTEFFLFPPLKSVAFAANLGLFNLFKPIR